MQHEPMSWQIVGNRFVHLKKRSQLGRISDGALRDWVNSMSAQERETFVEALFDVLSKGGKLHTLEELHLGGLTGSALLAHTFARADEEKRRVITDSMKRLLTEMREEMTISAEEGLSTAKKGLISMLTDWLK